MIQVKRALLSVSDKTGLTEFARFLAVDQKVEIISTGGTLRALQDAGVPAIAIKDYTGFPEIMDGRVKTLHPKIHGGLLALRDRPAHVKAMQDNEIPGIDLVCVNLYPFAATVAQPNVSFEDAIENIDIGGPTMLRAAASDCHQDRQAGRHRSGGLRVDSKNHRGTGRHQPRTQPGTRAQSI